MANPLPFGWRIFVLAVAAVVILAPGIGSLSGPTEKDEYHRVYRTALTMMENDQWIVPHLDGQPRLKKPPLVTWLTRLSFESFGVSLVSARAIGIAFAALLVVATALIGRELSGSPSFGVRAGWIALSTTGLAVNSRFLLHDIPAAALSGLAYYFFLQGCRSPLRWPWLLMAIALAAGFLAKGPVVFVVSGAGIAATIISSPARRRTLLEHWRRFAAALMLGSALVLPWILFVLLHYPEALANDLENEWIARRLGELSWAPLPISLAIILPWSFIFLRALLPGRDDQAKALTPQLKRLLLVFWVLTLVPFFFFRFSERYIIGSHIAAALIAATLFETADDAEWRWPARLGAAAMIMPVMMLGSFAWWVRTANFELTVVLGALALFGYFWWHAKKPLAMALTAGFLSLTTMAFLLPSFGFNSVPTRVVERAQKAPVALFGEPSPAFLPVLLKRSLPVIRRPDELANFSGGLVFVMDRYQDAFEAAADASHLKRELIDSFSSLGSVDELARRLAKSANRALLRELLRTRSLEPAKHRVHIFQLRSDGQRS